MKKVTILTLVGANNIGAFLQAFALKETLEDLGYLVKFGVIPSHHLKGNRYSKILHYLKHRNFSLLLYKTITAKKYNQARTCLPCETLHENEHLETVVIGSDEVWNLDSASFVHHPQYFAKSLNAEKVISYAACCGNCSPEKLTEQNLDFWDFDHLSVRDQHTYDFVRSIDARTPQIVLDPTFLIKSYDAYIPAMSIRHKYIMVYSYGLDKEAVKAVKQFAKEKNLPTYSVGTYNRWCDKNIIVDPFSMLAYLKNAEYVVTSTFHGTALSIKFNKEFVVYAENGQKILSLLDSFSLSDRNVSLNNNLRLLFCEKIRYDEVNTELFRKMGDSISYLTSALNEEGI